MLKKTTERKSARIASVMLSVLLAVCCVYGCAADSSRPSERENDAVVAGVRTASPADVWFAPSTQKIRADIDKSQYADVARSGVNLAMGKAETESIQIIMSAKEDIGAYRLKTADLTLTDNDTVKFPIGNITVYNQRYINVTTVREVSPGSTPGLYPDALVPFEAAAVYGENKAAKDTNQGLWVTFSTPEDCTPGEYTGEFTLDMDGYEQKIPVSLTVRDYDFAKNHTAQNCFLIDWTSFSYGELDSSEEMYDAYARALLDYRLQPGMLMNDFLRSDKDDIAYYTDKAFALALDPRCTVVFMPWDIKNDNDTYLVKPSVEAYLRAFATKSFESFGTEDELNLVKKTRVYFTFIDEPQMGGLIPRTNRAMADFSDVRKSTHDAMKAELDALTDEDITAEERAFRQEVIDDILNVHAIVTGPHDDRMTGVEVYCPLIDEYDSEQKRESYANDTERWWYTAVGPRYPYPGYHIDNTSLLSVRLMSWMQSEYDVVGNLYWATNLYNSYSTEEFIEDMYEFPLRYSGANGDGFLFYPGKRYGLHGPIGSVRLQNIRDGLEEYEILRAVRSIYEDIDEAIAGNAQSAHVNFDDVYSRMRENLYSGTSVYTTQDYFDEASDLFGNLTTLAAMGGAVGGIESGTESATVKLVLPKESTVEFAEGEGRSSVKHGLNDKYDLFVLTQPMKATANSFECSVTNAGKTVSVRINLGGAVTERKAVDMIANLKTGVTELATPSDSDKVLANTVDTELAQDDGTQWLQLKLGEATDRIRQTLVISDSELLSEIGKGTQKLVLEFYNDRTPGALGEKDEGKYDFRLQFKYAGDEYYSEIRQGQLAVGYNVITIGNMFGYDWDDLGALSEIRIFLGETSSAATDDIYFIGAKAIAL